MLHTMMPWWDEASLASSAASARSTSRCPPQWEFGTSQRVSIRDSAVSKSVFSRSFSRLASFLDLQKHDKDALPVCIPVDFPLLSHVVWDWPKWSWGPVSWFVLTRSKTFQDVPRCSKVFQVLFGRSFLEASRTVRVFAATAAGGASSPCTKVCH